MIKQALLVLMIMVSGLMKAQTNIMLISLPDKDTIDYKYPVFNWFYTAPQDGRDNIKYNYVLTELNADQSALAGVTVNQPLIRINGVQGFQLVYPFDAPELEYNHRYGWQLEKTVNNIIVEKSEVWEFTLYRKILIPAKYSVLNTDYSATIYEVTGDGFFFKLPARYKAAGNPDCRVLNENSQVMDVQLGEDQKLGENEEPEKTGSDFHYLRTDQYASGIYTLIVKDPKGNEYNTRFRIR